MAARPGPCPNAPWSDCDPRDYKSFRSRASRALKILEKLAVKYRPMDEED